MCITPQSDYPDTDYHDRYDVVHYEQIEDVGPTMADLLPTIAPNVSAIRPVSNEIIIGGMALSVMTREETIADYEGSVQKASQPILKKVGCVAGGKKRVTFRDTSVQKEFFAAAPVQLGITLSAETLPLKLESSSRDKFRRNKDKRTRSSTGINRCGSLHSRRTIGMDYHGQPSAMSQLRARQQLQLSTNLRMITVTPFYY